MKDKLLGARVMVIKPLLKPTKIWNLFKANENHKVPRLSAITQQYENDWSMCMFYTEIKISMTKYTKFFYQPIPLTMIRHFKNLNHLEKYKHNKLTISLDQIELKWWKLVTFVTSFQHLSTRVDQITVYHKIIYDYCISHSPGWDPETLKSWENSQWLLDYFIENIPNPEYKVLRVPVFCRY